MCHKFMDDSTLTEACDDPLDSTMQDAADQVTDLSKENHTKLNGTMKRNYMANIIMIYQEQFVKHSR